MLRVISAGAAKSLVAGLEATFATESGATIEGTFGPVSLIAETFVSGAPCDVLITSVPQLEGLAGHGLLRADSLVPIGTVRTAIAVPVGDALPDISTPAALAIALQSASAIYLPDVMKSTAGSHVLDVLRRLGLADALQPRLRTFANGETAMRMMSEERLQGAIGCTQATEIKASAGVTLVGPLPGEYALSTRYGAAISTATRAPDLARAFVALLTGAHARDLRAQSGFEVEAAAAS